jgi:BlaI family transcriptional regulator, penicillinase repressor
MHDLPTPTPRESHILKILWELGPSSVRDVHRHLLQSEPELAYNTVQTFLRIMEDKGLASHKVERRTFIYSACFSREESASRFLDRVFDGLASQLVQTLLTSERIPPQELDRMQVMINSARRKNAKQGGRP